MTIGQYAIERTLTQHPEALAAYQSYQRAKGDARSHCGPRGIGQDTRLAICEAELSYQVDRLLGRGEASQ